MTYAHVLINIREIVKDSFGRLWKIHSGDCKNSKSGHHHFSGISRLVLLNFLTNARRKEGEKHLPPWSDPPHRVSCK